MITIIAIDNANGWAYISMNYYIYTVRYPYKLSNLKESSNYDCSEAVNSRGFESCCVKFDDLSEVVKYLEQEYVNWHESRGEKIPSQEELTDLMFSNLPDEVLLKIKDKLLQCLDKIERRKAKHEI